MFINRTVHEHTVRKDGVRTFTDEAFYTYVALLGDQKPQNPEEKRGSIVERKQVGNQRAIKQLKNTFDHLMPNYTQNPMLNIQASEKEQVYRKTKTPNFRTKYFTSTYTSIPLHWNTLH